MARLVVTTSHFIAVNVAYGDGIGLEITSATLDIMLTGGAQLALKIIYQPNYEHRQTPPAGR